MPPRLKTNLLARLHGRAEGWKIAIGLLALFVLYSVAR